MIERQRAGSPGLCAACGVSPLEPSAGRARQRQGRPPGRRVPRRGRAADAGAARRDLRRGTRRGAERARRRPQLLRRSLRQARRPSGARTATKSTSAPRWCAPRATPDSSCPTRSGRLRLLDYQVRAKIGPDRRARHEGHRPLRSARDRPGRPARRDPDALPRALGDPLSRSATRRCACCSKASTYCAIAEANRAALGAGDRRALRARRRERAAAAAWCSRARATGSSAASDRPRRARRGSASSSGSPRTRPRRSASPVHYLALRLDGDPGWTLRRGRPGAQRPRAAAAGVGAERGAREAEAEAAAARARRAGAAGRRGRSVAAGPLLQRERQLPRGRSHRASRSSAPASCRASRGRARSACASTSARACWSTSARPDLSASARARERSPSRHAAVDARPAPVSRTARVVEHEVGEPIAVEVAEPDPAAGVERLARVDRCDSRTRRCRAAPRGDRPRRSRADR